MSHSHGHEGCTHDHDHSHSHGHDHGHVDAAAAARGPNENATPPKPPDEPIFAAIKAGDIAACESLLAENGNETDFLKETDTNGHYPLHWASQTGSPEIVKWLIENGSPFDRQSQDSTGMLPLHWAATKGKLECAHHLIQAGAEVDGKDKSSCTPLLIAAQYGQALLVTYLVRQGADVFAVDREEDTALHWAAYKGNEEIVALFLALGLKPNVKDNHGQNPLHLAAMQNNSAALELLIEVVEEGCPEALLATDNKGRTPAKLAHERHNYGARRTLTNATDGKWYECWNIVGTSKLQIPFMFVWFQITVGALAFPLKLIECPAVNQASLILGSTIFSFFLMMYMLIKCYNTDAGAVKKGSKEFDKWHQAYKQMTAAVAEAGSAEALGGAKVCHTCQIVRPPRSKHCRITKSCVRQFDHYCPFVNNAVGQDNYPFFFGYVLFHTICTALVASLAIMYLWTKCLAFLKVNQDEQEQQARLLAAKVTGAPFNSAVSRGSSDTSSFNTVSEMLMGGPGAGGHDFWGWTLFFDACLFCWLGGSMLVSHAYLVMANLTTNEAVNWKKYPDFRDSNGKYKNKYDRGPCANIMERLFMIGAPDNKTSDDAWSVLGGPSEGARLMAEGVEMTDPKHSSGGAARSRAGKGNPTEAEETENLL
jgi:ankyrin repeat protein